MSEDEFTKLFKHMNKRFDNVDDGFRKVHRQISNLHKSVDAYAKQTETYMQEMLSLGHKVDRLEQWILKVAEATGVKLST